MNIYLSHSTALNYEEDLYRPLEVLAEHEIFLPHKYAASGVNTRTIIQQSDLILAEVSLPSTGQGIELGWANTSNVPIICFYRSGSKISGSLSFISSTFIEYDEIPDMLSKLQEAISRLN